MDFRGSKNARRPRGGRGGGGGGGGGEGRNRSTQGNSAAVQGRPTHVLPTQLRSVYFKGLPQTVTKQQIANECSKYAQVKMINMKGGTAIVLFQSFDDVTKVIENVSFGGIRGERFQKKQQSDVPPPLPPRPAFLARPVEAQKPASSSSSYYSPWAPQSTASGSQPTSTSNSFLNSSSNNNGLGIFGSFTSGAQDSSSNSTRPLSFFGGASEPFSFFGSREKRNSNDNVFQAKEQESSSSSSSAFSWLGEGQKTFDPFGSKQAARQQQESANAGLKQVSNVPSFDPNKKQKSGKPSSDVASFSWPSTDNAPSLESSAQSSEEKVNQFAPEKSKEATTSLDESITLLRRARDQEKIVQHQSRSAIIGRCQKMCPELEVLERIRGGNIDPFETDEHGNPDPELMVKVYHRNIEPVASEMRPDPVMAKTLDHILNYVLPRSTDFTRTHIFVRDRMRSLRQDRESQSICSETSVRILECGARFHVISYQKCCCWQGFDFKQNTDNLKDCILILKNQYEYFRSIGKPCPNEAEFCAYRIILDPKPKVILEIPSELFSSPAVQFALRAVGAVAQNNFVRFFELVRIAPFHMASLLLTRFNEVRRQGMETLSRITKFSVPLSDLVNMFGFEDEDDARNTVIALGYSFDDKGNVSFSHKEPKTAPPVLGDNQRLVGHKERNRPLKDLVACGDNNVFVPYFDQIPPLPVSALTAINLPLPVLSEPLVISPSPVILEEPEPLVEAQPLVPVEPEVPKSIPSPQPEPSPQKIKTPELPPSPSMDLGEESQDMDSSRPECCTPLSLNPPSVIDTFVPSSLRNKLSFDELDSVDSFAKENINEAESLAEIDEKKEDEVKNDEELSEAEEELEEYKDNDEDNAIVIEEPKQYLWNMDDITLDRFSTEITSFDSIMFDCMTPDTTFWTLGIASSSRDSFVSILKQKWSGGTISDGKRAHRTTFFFPLPDGDYAPGHVPEDLYTIQSMLFYVSPNDRDTWVPEFKKMIDLLKSYSVNDFTICLLFLEEPDDVLLQQAQMAFGKQLNVEILDEEEVNSLLRNSHFELLNQILDSSIRNVLTYMLQQLPRVPEYVTVNIRQHVEKKMIHLLERTEMSWSSPEIYVQWFNALISAVIDDICPCDDRSLSQSLMFKSLECFVNKEERCKEDDNIVFIRKTLRSARLPMVNLGVCLKRTDLIKGFDAFTRQLWQRDDSWDENDSSCGRNDSYALCSSGLVLADRVRHLLVTHVPEHFSSVKSMCDSYSRVLPAIFREIYQWRVSMCIPNVMATYVPELSCVDYDERLRDDLRAFKSRARKRLSSSGIDKFVTPIRKRPNMSFSASSFYDENDIMSRLYSAKKQRLTPVPETPAASASQCLAHLLLTQVRSQRKEWQNKHKP